MSSLITKINWLEREQIVELLESIGIACYDSESTKTLREALLANVEDGSIDEADIPD